MTGKPINPSLIKAARIEFHQTLIGQILTIENGIPSNADKSNKASVRIANQIIKLIGGRTRESAKAAGQTSGSEFEKACKEFLDSTFLALGHLRPGRWRILQGSDSEMSIDGYEQFSHLNELAKAAKDNPGLRAFLGNDYTIKPDVLIVRDPEPDKSINSDARIVDSEVAQLASLRERKDGKPILHASISCKWTMRSDRSQNARTEALNLIRNRKGRLPHIVAVTAEPTPSRLASIALGTGDIDCVYHFALPELEEAMKAESEDSQELLQTMVEGKRLKDISDLPIDLAI